MTNSKRKGSTGEVEAAHALTEAGFACHRSQQYCGVAGNADITFEDKAIDSILHVEVKRVQALNIHKAMEQAISDMEAGKYPVVMHRKNGKRWLMTMDFVDWCEIVKEWLELRSK